MSQSSEPRALPKRIGRYLVERRLGAGGMGAVFLARDEKLGRRVAIKLPLSKGLTPTHRTRFEREAKAAAAIRHPNVCPVYEVGEVQGRPFIAMAFIEGRPLSELIDPRRPFEQRRAVEIVHGIANGLAAAHAVGVVHRDVKPQNVVLDERGEPILMDFGLARIVETAHEGPTRAGDVLGTPAYMAPEQVDGVLDEIGFHTDVYALGVVLYEMLAGRLPFTGSRTTIREEILRGEPTPLVQHRPDVEPSLAALCAKAMSLDPQARFRTANEFAAATKAWLVNDTRRSGALPVPGRGPLDGASSRSRDGGRRSTAGSKARSAPRSVATPRVESHEETVEWGQTAAEAGTLVGSSASTGRWQRAFWIGIPIVAALLAGIGLWWRGETPAAPGGPKTIDDRAAAEDRDGKSDGTGGDDEGWTRLFNGRDLTGWTAMQRESGGLRPHPAGSEGWEVENGLLRCTYGAYGILVAPGLYGDLELEAEVRLPEGAGFAFLIRQQPDSKHGVPVAIVDGDIREFAQEFSKGGSKLSGDQARALIAYFTEFDGAADELAPPGEWNEIRILCTRRAVTLFVNDKTAADLSRAGLGNPLERLPPQGFLALVTTGQSNGIEFRSLRIREVSP